MQLAPPLPLEVLFRCDRMLIPFAPTVVAWRPAPVVPLVDVVVVVVVVP